MPATIAAPTLLAEDMIGRLVLADGMVYYLTSCCGASATGSADGVACRACYRPVSHELGRGWVVSDESSWVAYAERMRGDLAEFTDRMVGRVRERAQRLSA